MRLLSSFASRCALAAGGSLLLGVACSSPVVGDDGDKAPEIPTFDVAVGADVTLYLGDSLCNHAQGSPAGACLSKGRPSKLNDASVTSSGVVDVTNARLEKSEVWVTVHAQKVGETMLAVEYADRRGEITRDVYRLRAHEITHVTEAVRCQWPDPPPDHRYPVPPASTVDVQLTAMADAIPLLTGAMELVRDRGGLEIAVAEPDTTSRTERGKTPRRAVTLPTALGDYTFVPIGPRSQPVALSVYDPAAVGVWVRSTSPKAISVRPAVGGAPTCVYEGAARATVTAEGACRVLLGDFEVEGALPVTMSRGGASFEVTGKGGCTVAATLGGAADRATFEADAAPAPLASVPGTDVGVSPVEIGGALQKRGVCIRTKSISNGKCEAINAGGYFVIPDGDCLIDFDWTLEHHDGTSTESNANGDGALDANAAVGVGLFTEVRVGLVLQLFGILGLKSLVPNALKVEATGLDVASLGCDRTDYEALSVRASAPGSHSMRFTADNAPGPRDFAVRARAVTKVGYLSEQTDTRVSGATTTSAYFVGSKVPIKMTYADGAGPLRGVAPYAVNSSSDGASASVQGNRVFTGIAPNRITLATPVAPAIHVLDVVDAAAVRTIGGMTPVTTGTPGRDEVCVEPFPQAASGQRIHGVSPSRPRISFAGGDTCSAVGGVFPSSPITTNKKLCLHGDATAPAGQGTEVRVAWGQTTASWPCQKQ